MTVRRTQAQNEMIEHLNAKYLVRKKISDYDLAVTQKPSLFRKNTKPSAQFSNCVDSAKADLRLLNFYFNHLKPMYRLRILNSNEFNSFIEKILYAQGSFHLQTREEQTRSLKIALQMLDYARNVIKENMPKEFQEVLEESSKPFWRTIKAISAYQKREKLKDSADIQIRYTDSVLSGFP